MNPDDPTDEHDPHDADPTEELDPTTRAGRPELEPIGPDRIEAAAALRIMVRRVLLFAVPLVLVGILLVALGLPIWLIVIALLLSLAIVVFEIDI